MKPRFTKSRLALTALALLSNQATAGTTFNGNAGATTGNWGTGANWEGTVPTFSATTDLLFRNFSAGNRTTSLIGGDRTVRSLTFNGNVTTGFEICLTIGTYNAAVNLTMGDATNAAAITVGSTAAGNITIGNARSNAWGNITLANDLAVAQNSANATLIIDTRIQGDFGLTKTGNGTLTLAGNRTSTYIGNTTINGGTLKLTGSATTGTGAVSLGTVGTLDVSAKTGGYSVSTLVGSGTVSGNLTVSTELAIGNSPGAVTFNNGLTLGNDATYTYELIGAETPGLGDADLANVTGALNITGAILDLVQLGTYTANNKFTLFAYSGGLTGTFKDAVGTNLLDGATFTDADGTWMIDYDDGTAGSNGGTGSQFVTITAIPEPDVAMLLGGLGMLTLLRRRRA